MDFKIKIEDIIKEGLYALRNGDKMALIFVTDEEIFKYKNPADS